MCMRVRHSLSCRVVSLSSVSCISVASVPCRPADVHSRACRSLIHSPASQRRRFIMASSSARRDSSSPSSAASASASAPIAVEYQGTCYCGKTRVSVKGAVKSASICHCNTCRKLSGAPFLAQALFSADDVEVSSDIQMASTQTSKAVTRYRCGACGSPTHASLATFGLTALPLSILVKESTRCPEELRPQLHLHYDSRVLDVNDQLPKYRKSVRHGELHEDD